MTEKKPARTAGRLILVLGDQLSLMLSALHGANKAQDVILMAEVAEEASYVPHHKKKIAFLFSAMRHHADLLRQEGWSVRYVHLDDSDNKGTLPNQLSHELATSGQSHVVMTEPGEYRLKHALQDWAAQNGVALDMREDTRFVCSHAEFQTWAQGRKQLRMEYF
jgi:deoxyribodipyrimidine photolyase-related protein